MDRISIIALYLVALAAGFQTTRTPEELATQLVHRHCQNLRIESIHIGDVIGMTGIIAADCDKRLPGGRWEKRDTRLWADDCLGWNYTRPEGFTAEP